MTTVMLVFVLIALSSIGYWILDQSSHRHNRKPVLVSVFLSVGLMLLCFVIAIPLGMAANPANEGLALKLFCLPALFFIPAIAATFSETKKMRRKMLRVSLALPVAALLVLFWRELLQFAIENF